MSKLRSSVDVRALGAGIALIALFAAPVVYAQTSVLTGVVRDTTTKAPVADVVVTATSPALQGEQVVVTDATGLYRIPQLPPGAYTLRFEKESYRPLARGGIDLRTDVTLRADVEMLPEAAQVTQEVTVVGAPPIVDVGSSTTGGQISSDFVKNIAVARPSGTTGSGKSFESLAATLPQASSDEFGVSINGASSPENAYQIDGMSTNHLGYNFNASPLSYEFVEEVNVITGGYMPEYGRTQGGTINAVTKSGSNEFHGSVWGDWAPGALASVPKAGVNVADSFAAPQAQLWNTGDFGATLGGYILKDKLWFFAGLQPSFSRYNITDQLQTVNGAWSGCTAAGKPCVFTPDGTGTTLIPGTQMSRFADQRELQYIGKLTYLVNQDQHLSLSITGTPRGSGGGNSFPFNSTSNEAGPTGSFKGSFPSATGGVTNETSSDVNLRWNGAFANKRFLVDANVAWHHEYEANLPGDGLDWGTTASSAFINQPAMVNVPFTPLSVYGINAPGCPAGYPTSNTPAGSSTAACGATNYSTGGGNILGFLDEKTGDSYQGNATATYLLTALGHHVIKAGFAGTYGVYQDTAGYPGGGLYVNYGSYIQLIRAFGTLAGPDNMQGFRNIHVQTAYSLVGGFLQDSWSILDLVTANIGLRYDDQTLYNSAGQSILSLPNQWAPRVGLVWDPTQSGKSKIYANYSVYYQNVPLDMADREIAGTHQQGQPGYEAFIIPPKTCDVNNPASCVSGQPFATAIPTNPSQTIIPVGQTRAVVDPNIAAPYTSEIVAGGDYEVFANARASLFYTHRSVGRALEDFSTDNTATYLLGNPGFGIGAYLPPPQRDYDAVTAAFVKNFSELWLAQVSYTWSRLYGNYDGFFLPQAVGPVQLDPGITAAYDIKPFVINSTGMLDGDVTHTVKAFASKSFVFAGAHNVDLGLSYIGHSGFPTSYMTWSSLYQQPIIYITQRGDGPRTPWVNELDGHIGYGFHLSKDSQLEVSADVFNLFNWQTTEAVDQTFTLQNNPATGSAFQAQSIPHGNPGQLANCYPNSANSSACPIKGTDNSPWDPRLYNPNFGKPTAYQQPRLVRLGVKLTF